jgi:hypothetical protein
MQTSTQNNEIPFQQVYQLVSMFSIEQQLIIAEHIKKQALAAKWNQFMRTMPCVELELSDEEIVAEIKAVRNGK